MEYEVYIGCNILGTVLVLLIFFFHFAAGETPPEVQSIKEE